ncbi:MAG: hypothetical protein ACJA2C_002771, partial [Marinoscillum sp.]
MIGAKFRLLFLISISIISPHLLGAQNIAAKKINTDSLPSNILLNDYHFKYINKRPVYYDADALKRIEKLDKEEDWSGLYKALKNYVDNFGIQNFYKDTKLIWRLAKLTEFFGGAEEAKSLYRLALRHHHNGINLKEIELYYDSLNTQAAGQYVPLDYYYELVEYRKLIDTLRPPRGVLLNMGKEINSSKADYAPSLNVQNNVLIFTSQRNDLDITIRRTFNEDLFYSLKDDFGTWSQAKPFKEINSRYKEGSAILSR